MIREDLQERWFVIVCVWKVVQISNHWVKIQVQFFQLQKIAAIDEKPFKKPKINSKFFLKGTFEIKMCYFTSFASKNISISVKCYLRGRKKYQNLRLC
jgi:hypothetical protein